MRCSPTPTSAPVRSSRRSPPAPTSSSPVGSPTRRCSSRRSCTSTGGPGTTGTGWPPASSSATCSSAPGRCAGGNYSGRWWENFDPLRIPFPIGEVEADGTAVITKPAGTGGAVTFDTVREQLLYEVHDPARYLNPDVVADFTSLRLEDLGDDRVRVSGARGARRRPRPTRASCARLRGGRARPASPTPWPDAEAKARAALGFVRTRAEAAGVAVEEWREEYFGVDAFGGPTVAVPDGWEPPEVIGRLAWRCADEKAAAAVGREAGLLGLSGPPTIAGVGRGRDGGPTQLLAVDPLRGPEGPRRRPDQSDPPLVPSSNWRWLFGVDAGSHRQFSARQPEGGT